MSNVHKNPTISFRVSEWERREIETRIKTSGLLKKDYFVRSCIYNRICVVGKKETIVPMLEEMQNMQIILKEVAEDFKNGEVTLSEAGLEEMRCDFAEIMEHYQMKWLQKGTHEKHLSVYDYEKKMRKAEVEELGKEISGQKDTIASQSFMMEVNEEALQSQEQILEENEAKAEQIRQETEQAKEDWEKVQTDKDRAQDSYEHYKSLEESKKGLYELYRSWYENKKKSYEEYAEKSSMLEEKTDYLEQQIKELEQRKSDKAEEVQAEEIKLDIVKMQLQEAVDDFEEMQKQADFVKEQAMQQYEKYRRVEPSERGTAMFDDMLRLKRENMILQDENRTLKEKLQKAYDFMKQFTINGLNMLECFLESVGERVQSFSENISFGGRSR